jgi:hypothetical protein
MKTATPRTKGFRRSYDALPAAHRAKLRALIAHQGQQRTVDALHSSDHVVDALVSGGFVLAATAARIVAALDAPSLGRTGS